MTDKTDIVARLRAYTRHDRPVLSSDLKEAADHIEALCRELQQASRKSDNSPAIKAGPILVDFVRCVSEAAGCQVPNAFDRIALERLVWHVSELRRERNRLRPLEEDDDDDSDDQYPGESQPAGGFAERMNELDARIARLESSVRLTAHRLHFAQQTMEESCRHSPTPSGIVHMLSVALKSEPVK